MKITFATAVAVFTLLIGYQASADTTLFGQVDAGMQYTDGNTKLVTPLRGTFVGVKYDNDNVTGADLTTNSPFKLFGTVSADIQPKDDTLLKTRDLFGGVGYGPIDVSFGRMPNLQQNISDSTIDIFAQGTSLRSQNATRNDKTLKLKTEIFEGFNVVGAVVSENGGKTVDSWELGNSYSLGRVNLVSAYAKNENTGVRTLIGGGTTNFGNVTVGGIYEQDKTTAGITTDTINLVTSLELGDQTVKGGYKNIEDGADTYMAEVSHNFTDSALAYINTNHTTDEDSTYTVGFRYSF